MIVLNQRIPLPPEYGCKHRPNRLWQDTCTVAVPANTRLIPGTVLGRVAGRGYWATYDASASDGREIAGGVLYEEIDNTAGVAGYRTATVLTWGKGGAGEVQEDAPPLRG